MDPMPVTGNVKVDHFFAIVGVVMSVASTAASVLNAKVRGVLDAGEEVPKAFLWLALCVNYLALNMDKAAQIHRLLKGGSVVVTRVEKPEAKE